MDINRPENPCNKWTGRVSFDPAETGCIVRTANGELCIGKSKDGKMVLIIGRSNRRNPDTRLLITREAAIGLAEALNHELFIKG